MFNPLNIIGSVVNGISSYVSKKQEQKKLKIEHTNKIQTLEMEAEVEVAKGNAQAKIEFAKTGQVQDYDLDKIAMQNMEKSWKDEVILIVFIAPMLMAFIPGMQELALTGFKNIAQMPTWYVYIIIGMVVVIFGMRGLLKWVLQKKTNLIKKED